MHTVPRAHRAAEGGESSSNFL